VDRLTRADLVAFHREFFVPSNILIGVAGDISKKDAQRKLEALFSDWEDRVVHFPAIPAAAPQVARVAVADKDLTQSTVILGHLGPTELDPHRASGQVMMDILGSGGFTSYIIDRVRNDSGLAYMAGGFLSFGRLDRGFFVAYALSKASTTCQATRLILEQIKRIREEPVTDEELRIARDGILNAEAFRYDSTEEIVDRLMSLTYYGLPADHDEKLIERIARVSQTDVQEAARSLLAPDDLSLVAVGAAGDFDCNWSEFAEEWGVPLQEIELEESR
jgi:predicted Zn-dependent peptidase